MNENVVCVIVENDTRMFVNMERRAIQPDLSFKCFLPSQEEAKKYRQRSLGDSQGRYFHIQEVEIVEFLNNQLTVAYENNEEEVAPF